MAGTQRQGRSKTAVWLAVFILWGLYLPRLHASEPTDKPIPRIETGMHTAAITRIGIDAAERFLVTGSDDKTVRVWELHTGRLLRVLRPPLDSGDEGKIYAVAISPDGTEIACGGWTGYDWNVECSIYIFDRAGGALKKRIPGLPNVILHLSYSKDGKNLAASIGGSNGIRIFNVPNYSETAKDTDYGSRSYWNDWDTKGRLVTTCDDSLIRLYNETSQLVAKQKAPGGERPFSANFSPDGSRICVGFDDSTSIAILSGKDLSLLDGPDTNPFTNGNLGRVSWSRDGRSLYAGGMYDKGGIFPIIKWSKQGKGPHTVLDGSPNTIMHILPLRDGGIVFGAADPAFGIIDKHGKQTLFKSPAIADFRGMYEKFRLGPMGKRVKFGYKYGGESPAQFSMENRRLDTASTQTSGMVSPVTKSKELAVTGWKGTDSPQLNGKKLPLKQYEFSRSLAIAPDRETFLLGTEWYLRRFDRRGKEVWKQDVPGIAWAVNIAGNGKIAAAAYSDGTIRWYRMKDGKELLTFFPHNDQKRWVMWTPSGYYDASPGGEELFGWHLNRGKDRAADFFPASRFRDSHYRPDIVAQVLDTLDEAQAILAANSAAKKRKLEDDIRKLVPPVVTILSPPDGVTVSSRDLALSYSVRSPSAAPVTGIKVMVDGRPASRERRLNVVKKGETRTVSVTIPPKDCRVTLIAENRNAASAPETIRITWKTPDIKIKKTNLYILAIGVGRYHNPALKLDYPAKDARDFAEVMQKQQGGLYSRVTTRLLTDKQATKDNILDGLEWLEHEVTSKDVSMVFLAGHGKNDHKGTYYYFPVDVEPGRLKRTGVSFLDIKDTVKNVPCKSLLFADTCEAANITGSRRRGDPGLDALVNELVSAENGVVVFTASSGGNYALENDAWGNGAFTLALLEGLKGKADIKNKGKVTITMLEYYLAERVKQLTGGKQKPAVEKPKTIEDFPIAVIRD